MVKREINKVGENPERVCIIGYNTLAEAKAKGLISDDPASLEVWYNPGSQFKQSLIIIPYGKEELDINLTTRIRYVEWNFPKHPIKIVRFLFGLRQLFKAVKTIAKMIRTENLQVVRANGPHVPALIAFILRIIVYVPTIVFIEAFWEKILPSQKKIPSWLKYILPLWYKIIVYRKFETYCGTPSVDPDFYVERGVNRDKISDWFHELDLEALIQKSKYTTVPSSVLVQSRPRLVSVGRLHNEKHPDDLIDVLTHTKKNYPTASLILVGEGEEREGLIEKATKLGVADSFCITGMLSQAQGLAVVSACDIYVAPMQGNALVEAMAAGKPIVAYDHAWHRNIIDNQHTGLLTKYRDVKLMGECVIFLLQNPTVAKRLGKDAEKYALSCYGRTAIASRLIKPFVDAFNSRVI